MANEIYSKSWWGKGACNSIGWGIIYKAFAGCEPPVLLLDEYSGAAAAYSLRKLSSTTTNVVRVRRSSDNAELDFTATDITDGTLTTWTGANDGFVTVWYDQSGNAYNVTQTTAGNQPKIVDIGSVILENGKPAVEFDGSNDGLENTSGDVIATNAANSVLVVGRNISIVNFQNIIWAKNVIRLITAASAAFIDFSIFNTSGGVARYPLSNIPNFTQYLLSIYWDGVGTASTDYSIYGDNSLLTTTGTVSGATPTTFSVGYRNDNSTQYWNGRMQELIIYPSDNSSNNIGMNTNINDFYSIY